MPQEQEMYKLVCEKRFDKQEEQNQHIIDLLKGEGKNPGLVDKVRNNCKALKRLYALFIFCGGAIILQVIGAVAGWIKALFTH